MGLLDFWKRSAPKTETRAVGSGFTAEVIAARESYISGRRGIAELTATAQSCVSLWEGGLSLADVKGTNLLTCQALALAARSAALRGEAVFLIRETGLVPASDWDVKTRDGRPIAYRLSIPEAGGGRSETALAAEVLHLRIAADPSAPWYGQAPLRRANLTAGLLHQLESSLSETFEFAPLGSQIVPFPETPEADLESIGRSFRGNRGRVLLRESTQVSAAGGPAPMVDWRPISVSPDLGKSMTVETHEAARNAICAAFGVLPSLVHQAAAGPAIREGQRHLAQYQLAPIAGLLAEEATQKLGGPVSIDVMRPLQAFDVGGRARALSTIVQAMAEAKAAGLDPEQTEKALSLVDWSDGTN